MNVYYLFTDSDLSDIIQPSTAFLPPVTVHSPLKRCKGQYVKKTHGTSSEKLTRERNRIKAQLSRRRESIYKELVHLQMHTEWEALVVMRSKDHKKVVYGGTDEELIQAFVSSKPLLQNVENKGARELKKNDMSKVLLKVSKNTKRLDSVPESPDPSPSKVPECVSDMLPKSGSLAKQQAESLGSITLDKSDSQAGFLLPVFSFAKKKSKINLFCSKEPKLSKRERGRGRGQGKNTL